MSIKAICGAVALATVMFIGAAQAADAPAGAMAPAAAAPAAATEKCYGVAKAGKDVAIDLPVGVCEKLANGSLVAPSAAPAAAPEKK